MFWMYWVRENVTEISFICSLSYCGYQAESLTLHTFIVFVVCILILLDGSDRSL